MCKHWILQINLFSLRNYYSTLRVAFRIIGEKEKLDTSVDCIIIFFGSIMEMDWFEKEKLPLYLAS